LSAEDGNRPTSNRSLATRIATRLAAIFNTWRRGASREKQTQWQAVTVIRAGDR
jgi:hypothetical protein